MVISSVFCSPLQTTMDVPLGSGCTHKHATSFSSEHTLTHTDTRKHTLTDRDTSTERHAAAHHCRSSKRKPCGTYERSARHIGNPQKENPIPHDLIPRTGQGPAIIRPERSPLCRQEQLCCRARPPPTSRAPLAPAAGRP